MAAHDSGWKWWLAFSFHRTFTGYTRTSSLAHFGVAV